MSDSFNPLGMDPGLARNLMAFGAATMQGANARTPQGFLANGPGALGAIGAGILGMQNQQLAYSQLGSENNLRAAQAEHERANTALTQMQIPFMQQEMTTLQNLPMLMGSQPGPVPPVGNPQSFGGNPAPIPVGQRAAMVNQAVQGTNVPPSLLGSVVDQESAWDANAVSKTGAQGLLQIEPSTAKSPGFGMQGVDPNTLIGPQNVAANLKFGAQYLDALGRQEGLNSPADWALNQEAAARALARYNSGVPSPTAENGVYASTILARAKKGWSGIAAGNAVAAPGGVGTQIAQAGNGPVPLPGLQPPMQSGGQQQQPSGMPQLSGNPFEGIDTPQQAYQKGQYYYNIAQRMAGAPLLQGVAKQYSDQAAILMRYALSGPQARAEAMAKAPFTITRVGPGGVAYNGFGQAIGQGVPYRSQEVITSGPLAGTVGNVLRYPLTGNLVGGNNGEGGGGSGMAGAENAPGSPAGFIPEKLPPQQAGRLTAQGEVEAGDINHDRKVIEEDLAHVLDNAQPAQQQLLMLRGLAPQADTGAGGQWRAQVRNIFQTFAPGFATDWVDAAPAQEFNKIALMQAGKAERGDLGARGGYRAIEMYKDANPNLDMQPNANVNMANVLLIGHQRDIDYATGANAWYQANRSGFMDPNSPKPYQPISAYDQRFMQQFSPTLYYRAMTAINGAPESEWANKLTPAQIRIVGGIVQRADQTAKINFGGNGKVPGNMVPVTQFQNVLAPEGIGQ